MSVEYSVIVGLDTIRKTTQGQGPNFLSFEWPDRVWAGYIPTVRGVGGFEKSWFTGLRAHLAQDRNSDFGSLLQYSLYPNASDGQQSTLSIPQHVVVIPNDGLDFFGKTDLGDVHFEIVRCPSRKDHFIRGDMRNQT